MLTLTLITFLNVSSLKYELIKIILSLNDYHNYFFIIRKQFRWNIKKFLDGYRSENIYNFIWIIKIVMWLKLIARMLKLFIALSLTYYIIIFMVQQNYFCIWLNLWIFQQNLLNSFHVYLILYLQYKTHHYLNLIIS